MTPLRSELEEQLRGIGIAPGLPIDSPSVDQLISSLEALIEKREKELLENLVRVELVSVDADWRECGCVVHQRVFTLLAELRGDTPELDHFADANKKVEESNQ